MNTCPVCQKPLRDLLLRPLPHECEATNED